MKGPRGSGRASRRATAAARVEAGFARDGARREDGGVILSGNERSQVGIHWLEQDGGHFSVIAGQQHAFVANVGAAEEVFPVDIDTRVERHGPPEDLAQPFRGDSLDERQDERGGIGRIHHTGILQNDSGVHVRSQFPEPIDSFDRMIECIAGAGRILFGQAQGHEGPGADAFAGTAKRCGDSPCTRGIDAGETTAQPRYPEDSHFVRRPETEEPIGLRRIIDRNLWDNVRE